MDYPVQLVDTLKAVGLEELEKGISVYDFNQDASGILKIKIRGKAGQTIKADPRGKYFLKWCRRSTYCPKSYLFLYFKRGRSGDMAAQSFSYYCPSLCSGIKRSWSYFERRNPPY